MANRQKSRDGFPWTDVLIVGVIAMATAAFVGGGIGWSLGGGTDRFIAEQAREVEAQAARVIPGAKPHRPAASRRRFSTSHLQRFAWLVLDSKRPIIVTRLTPDP